jgi:hypothetical protein
VRSVRSAVSSQPHYTENNIPYHLTYDAENRLTGVSGAASATFGSATTVYVGNHFEWTGSTSTMKKYYYADGARVAMRQNGTLYYILTDHGHLRWLRVHRHHHQQRLSSSVRGGKCRTPYTLAVFTHSMHK